MRLTPSRVVLAALLLLTPAVPFVLAQDNAPSSAPSSEPAVEAPASDQPSDQPSAAPSSEQPVTDPTPDDEPPAEPKRTPRSDEEIFQDLSFFGEVFDRIRREYVDAPDEQELVRAAINGM